MKIIPKQVRDLFREFFKKFSSVEGVDYKQRILDEAENEEERKDLEELFQSTEAYYKTYEEVVNSGKSAAKYLLDFYIEKWEEENPNASEEDRIQAVCEYEEIVGNVAVQTLDLFKKDGIILRNLEKETKYCESKDEMDSKTQYFLSENKAFGEEISEEDSAIKIAQRNHDKNVSDVDSSNLNV